MIRYLTIRSSRTYGLDLTNDRKHDVYFHLQHMNAPSSNGEYTFKIILSNPTFKVVVTTEMDTICKDTIPKSGFEYYRLSNCNSAINLSRIDTTTYTPWFNQGALSSIPNSYNTTDTVLIYSEIYRSLFIVSPGAILENIKKGALKTKSEGYMVFKDNMDNKTALHIQFYGQYLILHKLVKLH